MPALKFLDKRILCNDYPVVNDAKEYYLHAEIGEPYDWGKYPEWYNGIRDEWLESPFGLYDFLKLPGMLVRNGVEYLVTEPEELTQESVEQLASFCKKNRLKFHILPTSWQHPTKTLRILMWSEYLCRWSK